MRFLTLLYHIWFYIIVALPIIVMSPVLLVLTFSEKTYPHFFKVARIWAYIVLYGMGCPPRVKGREKMKKGQAYMLVANHTSMTDIMLMLVTARNPFVFVGKKELVKIPIFGFFYKRVVIMVDRGNTNSRMGVYRRAQRRLRQGTGICIFPEGGVPDDTQIVLDRFKSGAFRLAIAHQIPLVPISFYDNKKRLPFDLDAAGPGIVRAQVHDVIATQGMGEGEVDRFRESVRNLILIDLTRHQKKEATP